MALCIEVLFLSVISLLSMPSKAWWAQDGKIFNDNGAEARLKGISWFGFETQDKVVDGLWSHSIPWYMDLMANHSINIIRIPYCSQLVLTEEDVYPNNGMIASAPECQGKNSFEIMDIVFDEAEKRGIGIMLDLHRLNDQYISELWYAPNSGEFTSDTYFQTWYTMLDRYVNRTNLIAIDLLNEPHGRANWGSGDPSTDWHLFAESAISKIYGRYPNITQLIFVESVMWSKDFTNVLNNPIRAPNADVQARIIYSPHSYGASVVPSVNGGDTNGLRGSWDYFFGYLRDHNFTLVPGEWGGRTAIDSQWMNNWADYMISRGMSNSFFWSLTPNSGDVQGLLLDDWTTVDQFKADVATRVQPNPILPLIIQQSTNNTNKAIRRA